eukprot:142519_1
MRQITINETIHNMETVTRVTVPQKLDVTLCSALDVNIFISSFSFCMSSFFIILACLISGSTSGNCTSSFGSSSFGAGSSSSAFGGSFFDSFCSDMILDWLELIINKFV